MGKSILSQKKLDESFDKIKRIFVKIGKFANEIMFGAIEIVQAKDEASLQTKKAFLFSSYAAVVTILMLVYAAFLPDPNLVSTPVPVPVETNEISSIFFVPGLFIVFGLLFFSLAYVLRRIVLVIVGYSKKIYNGLPKE